MSYSEFIKKQSESEDKRKVFVEWTEQEESI